MSKINYGRVILGGLVAGLVLSVGEFVSHTFVFREQVEASFGKLHLPPPGGSFVALAVSLTFMLGIVMICVYAMIRPRYGPGPKTAICAASVIWFCVDFYHGILNAPIFGLTKGFVIVALVWGIVEYSLAAIAGAWLYKE
jgi:hypothetical protein